MKTTMNRIGTARIQLILFGMGENQLTSIPLEAMNSGDNTERNGNQHQSSEGNRDDQLELVANSRSFDELKQLDAATSIFASFPIVDAFTYYFGSNSASEAVNGNRRSLQQCVSALSYYFILYAAIVFPLLPMGVMYRYLRLDVMHPHHSRIILEEPGLNFRPYPAQEINSKTNKSWGTFVHFNRYDRDVFQFLIWNIDSVVNKYEAHHERNSLDENLETHWTKRCTFEKPAERTHACMLNAQRFGTYCYRNMEYGYPDGQPCFLIRVNKVHGWRPEPYETFDELMAAGFPLDWDEKDFDPRYLPISCTGETDVDEELLGPVDYIYPFEDGKNGIPTYYFPYMNQLNFKSPGVMVNFWNVTVSVAIRIKCLLWARNVPHDYASGRLRGGVQFELMVDNGNVQREDYVPETEAWMVTHGLQNGRQNQ